MFIGLNPSTANETEDDPTIRRCIGFSKSWGFGGVCVVNLFGFRATMPTDMMSSKDPVGAENDAWIRQLADDAGLIVAAWGNDGSFMGRSKAVMEMIPNLSCLKINRTGEPAHPLYQPGTAVPQRFDKQRQSASSYIRAVNIRID